MRKLGPRVYVKRDEESSIGRGCILHGAHFRPEIAAMTHSACGAASRVDHKIATVRLTEGARDIRSSRDLHEELRAIDYTFEYANGMRIKTVTYHEIAREMQNDLGDDYDVESHAVDSDAIHTHCELDPK
jgi:hypothetical protein